MNLFVANIDRSVNEDALKALFSEFGEVLSVRLMTDKLSGHSRGFAFIEMLNEGQGHEAIRKLSNAPFFGRNLVVSKARPKVF